MKRLALVLVILLSLTLAPSALAKPIWADTGMDGLWITTDCATFWESVGGTHEYDCDLFGDKSAMSLDIAAGAVPMVRFVDTFSTPCGDRLVATGYGIFTAADFLTVTFTQSWCGAIPIDPPADTVGLGINHDQRGPSFDALWDDYAPNTDWGYTWFRAN